VGDQGKAADFDHMVADLQRQIILDREWFPFRWAFRRFECELAQRISIPGSEGDTGPPWIRQLRDLSIPAGLGAAVGGGEVGCGGKE